MSQKICTLSQKILTPLERYCLLENHHQRTNELEMNPSDRPTDQTPNQHTPMPTQEQIAAAHQREADATAHLEAALVSISKI